jgi:hypothetical protein
MIVRWFLVDGKRASLKGRNDEIILLGLNDLIAKGHKVAAARPPIDDKPKGYSTSSAMVRR